MTVRSISIRLQAIILAGNGSLNEAAPNERMPFQCLLFYLVFSKLKRTKRYATQTCVEHPSNNQYYIEFVFFNSSMIAIIRSLLRIPLLSAAIRLERVLIVSEWQSECYVFSCQFCPNFDNNFADFFFFSPFPFA